MKRIRKLTINITQYVFKVGKYQTAGGAIFQKGTECTIATYKPFEEQNSGGDIGKRIPFLDYHHLK